jgi:hypothetical protein
MFPSLDVVSRDGARGGVDILLMRYADAVLFWWSWVAINCVGSVETEEHKTPSEVQVRFPWARSNKSNCDLRLSTERTCEI